MDCSVSLIKTRQIYIERVIFVYFFDYWICNAIFVQISDRYMRICVEECSCELRGVIFVVLNCVGNVKIV